MKSQRSMQIGALSLALLALALAAAAVAALAPGPAAAADEAVLVDIQTMPPQTLDPHWLYDYASARVAAQVYDSLVERRGDDPAALVPALATDWQISADARTYTFHIRAGVSFHEGGTLEPHDVAYSLWRGMLQDRENGPMWMWFDLLFENAYSIDDLPGDDLARCQTVKEAVTYDDVAGTVTFHLAEPSGVLLSLFDAPCASVLDQEWMVANGDWGGACDNWRAYHDPAAADSLLYDRANGTGPFHLVHWTTSEVRMERYDGYWRRQPAWEGGPAGPAALEAVVIRYEPNWSLRRDLLLAGQADLVEVPLTGTAELAPYVWAVYHGFQDPAPTLVNPAGTLYLFQELPEPLMGAGLFCQGMETAGNPYIGTGLLDGDGIPPDFFTDLAVRQAFNYAVDWAAVISDGLAHEGQRARGPIPEGLLGYTATQPVYVYSPTLSSLAFQQAWGGQVWSQGFSMTLAYNEGAVLRQVFAEVLAQGVEAVNPKFHVRVIGLPWPDLLDGRRTRRLPVYYGGWIEDYHHPHNWVHPFLHSAGVYGGYQNFHPALAATLDAKVDECAAVTDPVAAATCYRELQNLSYVHATAMYGAQNLARTYLRTEVRGYSFRPGIAYPRYYALSKGLPPAEETLEAGTGTTVEFAHASGTATTTLEVPAGALSETVVVVHTPDVAVSEDHAGGFRLGGLTFDLAACPGGECQPGYAFDDPVTLTLHYDDADVVGLIEEELYLYTWDGSTWVDVVADCGWPPSAYGRYPTENRLVVPLCHLSPFALVGGTHNIYLPLVARND
jgi:peptide/nickel transport system substrate-binding protein